MMHSHTYFKKRLTKFRSFFPQMGVEGFVIENPTDLTYFTGLSLSKGRLLIGPRAAALFVDGRYREVARKRSPYPVYDWGEETLSKVANRWKGVKSYGFDTGIAVADHLALKKGLQKKGLKGIGQPTSWVRAIKDPQEITLLQKSADLLWKGFLQIRKKLRTGIKESDLAWEFESYVRQKGAEALSFPPIIAFGENSALPHHRSGERLLQKGDTVLVDIGVILNGYASDMTRTFFFGEGSKRMQKVHAIVLQAHQAVLKSCKAGVKVETLDQIARKEMGKEEKHFIHALGHGIGLDVHEFPRISSDGQSEVLREGMVITIEPGLYLPKVGGVRHEDMIVITKKGHRNLCKTLP